VELPAGFIGRTGIQFRLKINHSVYSNINLDDTQSSQTASQQDLYKTFTASQENSL
jgi:hypothetical protein